MQALQVQDIQRLLDRSPFAAFLGLRVVGADHAAQSLRMSMPLRPELERRGGSGQVHGGAIASLIDVAGDFAVGMLVGGGVPTINLHIDYLRPSLGGELQAHPDSAAAGPHYRGGRYRSHRLPWQAGRHRPCKLLCKAVIHYFSGEI